MAFAAVPQSGPRLPCARCLPVGLCAPLTVILRKACGTIAVTWVPSRVHGTQSVLNKSHPCWIALCIKEHTALSESGVEVRWQWESSLKVQVTPTEKRLVLPWVILSRGLGECPGRLEKHSIPGTSGGSRQDAKHQFTDCGFQRFRNHQSPQQLHCVQPAQEKPQGF